MRDSISHRSNRYFSPLVITHHKSSVSAMTIDSLVQISMKREKIPFEIILKITQFLRRMFSLSKNQPASPNIF